MMDSLPLLVMLECCHHGLFGDMFPIDIIVDDTIAADLAGQGDGCGGGSSGGPCCRRY